MEFLRSFTSFRGETTGGIAKCGLFSQTTIGEKNFETMFSNKVTSENKGIRTTSPVPSIQSWGVCRFYGSSNSGTKLYGGDRGGQASPF